MAQVEGTAKSDAAPYFEFDLVVADTNTRRFVSFGALGVGLLFWKISLRNQFSTFFRILGTLAILAGLGGFCRTKVAVNASTKLIVLQSRFWDRWTIRQRKFAFRDFNLILVRHDRANGTAHVCLRRTLGRKLVVRYGVSDSDCSWVARRLAKALDLRVDREEF
jgi:hypothetical protein